MSQWKTYLMLALIWLAVGIYGLCTGERMPVVAYDFGAAVIMAVLTVVHCRLEKLGEAGRRKIRIVNIASIILLVILAAAIIWTALM